MSECNSSRRAVPRRRTTLRTCPVAVLLLAPSLDAAAQADIVAAATLPPIEVVETVSDAERNGWPLTTETITARELAEKVNVQNTEDALKLMPGIVVRKRHIGDTQAPISTRTSGLGQSARSLVYADGLLLSALFGNNNSTASPRWGIVSPDEIERVDVMYGPFAAGLPGNSMGAVVQITTRMPEAFEASASLQGALQSFRLYATDDSYGAYEAGGSVGSRTGPFAWRVTARHLDSYGQPLAVVTVNRPTTPGGAGTPVTGAFADSNRTGAPIAVLGAGAIEHHLQDNATVKLAYDVLPTLRGTYTFGAFRNDDRAHAETYLRDANGAPAYSGALNIDGYAFAVPASAFSTNVYRLREEHTLHGLKLETVGDAPWRAEVIASLYDFGESRQRTPGAALPAANDGGPGTLNVLDGTGWRTLDARLFANGSAEASHRPSFGVHHDRYELVNPRYALSSWIAGAPGDLVADARGKTQTDALWAQDVIELTRDLHATAGLRWERWRAFDGFNFSTAPALSVRQPELSARRLSPKLAFAWEPDPAWSATASYGKAYRFPTVTELYQTITTGPILSVPDPNLRPEAADSVELAVVHRRHLANARVSLFGERLRDALISQSAPLLPGSQQLFNFVQNVDRVRSYGAEVVAGAKDVLPGLELSGSATYVDSTILEDARFPTAIGKRTPNIPRWRWTAVATYRPSDRVSATLSARHSDRVYATADNSDVYTHTYQGFDSFTVLDARIQWRVGPHARAAFGVDNLANKRYYLFHPFPQRTFLAELDIQL